MLDKNAQAVAFVKNAARIGKIHSGWGTYITKMAEANKENEKAERVEPVFFLNNEVKQENDKWLTTLEVCMAVCEVVENDIYIEGAQRIGGLWRIYLTDQNTRISLLSTGISLRGIQITLKDRNPFLNQGYSTVETTRVFVRNIPMSYDNTEIEKALKNAGASFLGPMKYARARTPAGKLTNFKTGDRFVDIELPTTPLPKKLSIGWFTASIYHKEQKQIQDEIECGNCRQKGHIRKDCKNEPVCFECMKPGHKKGDLACNMGMVESESEEEGEIDDEEELVEKAEQSENAVQQVIDDKLQKILQETEEKKEDHGEGKSQKLLTAIWKTGGQGTPDRKSSASPSRVRKAEDRSPEEISTSQKRKERKKAEKIKK